MSVPAIRIEDYEENKPIQVTRNSFCIGKEKYVHTTKQAVIPSHIWIMHTYNLQENPTAWEETVMSPCEYVTDDNVEIVLNKVFRETSETMAEYIEVNDSVMGGTPVIRGTRVPVFVVLNYLANKYSIEDITKDFPRISEEAIIASIKFASRIIEPREED